jgi:hypothetical protein
VFLTGGLLVVAAGLYAIHALRGIDGAAPEQNGPGRSTANRPTSTPDLVGEPSDG